MSTRTILRVEGALLLAAALAGYRFTGGRFDLNLVVLALPDIAIAGYLLGPIVGANVYNLTHTTVLPLALLMVSMLSAAGSFLFPIARLWIAHIGLDRMLGFGLKERAGFKDTHLGRILSD